MNLEQQHKLAKDLLHAAQSGDESARARIRAQRTDVSDARGGPAPKLADAQLTIAREAGFPSWPALVHHIEKLEMGAFIAAVRGGTAADIRKAVEASDFVRQHINEPVFDFGGRALHTVARDEAKLEVLLSFGADVALKSDWERGPFSVLDHANESTARYLIGRGATLTAAVAARLGWMNELRQIVEAAPAAVHERAGDGQQALHQAKTVAIADYLLDHGAGIDVPCIDHSSTPAQYALTERTPVCRRLLERGATPDIFMAAWLGDVTLAGRILDDDPSAGGARIRRPGYAPVPGLHMYCWLIGFLKTPHDVAVERGFPAIVELLERKSPPRARLLSAAMRADEQAARAALAIDPSIVASFSRDEHGDLAMAIFHGRVEAAALMLRLGYDPSAPGIDGGSALHAACWIGHVGLVEEILKRGVDLNQPDPTHLSPPLGWTAFGSVHNRAPQGDYVGVLERLVAAGADIHARGNGADVPMVEMAKGNPGMQEAIRRILALP